MNAVRPSSKLLQQPAVRVAVVEHCLRAEASPMVSLAMALPAGTKYSLNETDSGQTAAAYKHAILQGTARESRISLARKADLRPSPLSAHLSRDLLVLKADFHVNYLEEMLETFRGLFSERAALKLNEFDVETIIKPAVQLDGALATAAPDGMVELVEAAMTSAFRANRLYFSSNILNFSSACLDQFHKETLERSSSNNPNQHSLILSVNNSSILTREAFKEAAQSIGFHINDSSSLESSQVINPYFEGQSVRIETGSDSCEYLLSFPISGSSFSKNFQSCLILEALLKKKFPSAFLSTTSDSAFLSVHFKSSEELKAALSEFNGKNDSFIKNVNDESITWAQERAKFNWAMANDSRDSRLISTAHRFALNGKVGFEPASLDQIKTTLKDTFKVKPNLISRGNWKKMLYYQDLF